MHYACCCKVILVVNELLFEHLQAPAAKAGLMCLGQVLAAVEPGAWPAAAPGFQLLISFLTDARPKVSTQLAWTMA
jgi:hypothetical protein